MRRLATIQRIESINPIEGADSIEVATVLGWHVVVKKGEFKVGDPAVYIEIDSIVPDRPEFEFLRDRKFRVKTIRLRGQISQGILFPVSILPPRTKIEMDADVTDVIGVVKYDPQADAEQRESGRVDDIRKGRIDRFLRRSSIYRKILVWVGAKANRDSFPSFISKTDETRIQTIPNVLRTLSGTLVQATEKIDGQSATYFAVRKKRFLRKDQITFGVCSRRLLLPVPDSSSWWTVYKSYEIEKFLRFVMDFDSGIETMAIQGEIIGPRIQGNKYNADAYRFFAFNIIVNGVYSNPNGAENKAVLAKFKIPTVPIVWEGFLPETVDEVVKMADGKSVLNDTLREGLVFRTCDQKISFKAISNEFLLKWKE